MLTLNGTPLSTMNSGGEYSAQRSDFYQLAFPVDDLDDVGLSDVSFIEHLGHS